MSQDSASAAALTIALATAAGIIAQSVARSARIPGIIVLLFVGVLLGPDVAGWLDPATLGAAMPQVVGFAVAVILFEGGMHLNLNRFRQCGRSIRRLILLGALFTLVAGTLAAKYILGFDWRNAALFGSLVIVTGPTVVTPLVRRFRVDRRVATILEAEGVLIDALGAVIAVVALEIALEPTSVGLAKGVLAIATRLGFGTLVGLLGGFLLWTLLRYRGVVSEGLENVFTLALVWALYQGAGAFIHESGIAAVIMAGIVVGNLKHPSHRSLLEFNDQLTVMLIGMLFVLLAANVRIADVVALGAGGLITVAILVLLVRPAVVLAATAGSELGGKEKLFIAWLGPRGIIAAAVASLFADELERVGLAGGAELKAMVFLVIGITVVLAGGTGGVVARWLGVSRPPRGWLLLGANAVSCALARSLREGGQEVVCVDSSVDHCQQARQMGVEVILGNGLEEQVLHEAGVDMRAGVAAVTPNDEINLLFIDKAKHEGRVKRRYAALRSAALGVTTDMVHETGGQVLFGGETNLEHWCGLLHSGAAVVQRFTAEADAALPYSSERAALMLLLTVRRDDDSWPLADELEPKRGDELAIAIEQSRQQDAHSWLDEHGWHPYD